VTAAAGKMLLAAPEAAADESALASWESEGGPPTLPPSLRASAVALRLGWREFVAARYPGAARHDAAPLKAYEAYLNTAA
jgi:hypothetical protein